jgi:hypothetical protein
MARTVSRIRRKWSACLHRIEASRKYDGGAVLKRIKRLLEKEAPNSHEK